MIGTSAQLHVGAGEPVVLLHPFALSHHVWREVAADLAADHEVLAPTHLSHWRAARAPRGGYSVAACADHIERAMDAAGLETAHLVGNSLGGWVAFELERRGRARSVVALAPAGGWRRWTRGEIGLGLWFLSLYPAILAGKLVGDRLLALSIVQRTFLASVVHDPSRVDPARRVETLRATLHCPAYLPMMVAALRDGPVHDLSNVRAPVLLAWCEFDRVITRDDQRVRYDEELPEGTVRTLLHGVGHVPSLEQPERVAALIRDFVSRHRVPGRATA